MKKIVIFGASGIIGSHMRLAIPAGFECLWMRKHADLLHRGLDLERPLALVDFLIAEKPDVVINLAGESNTDTVERNPADFIRINSEVPALLAGLCERNGAHYIHVSTQAVFNGEHPPYHPKSQRQSVNEYGRQKILAEERVEKCGSRWTIVRPTFVLGVRPVPTMGRQNPIEQMMTTAVQRQVSDRWFSVSFARDVAAELWKIAQGEPLMKAVHVGIAHGVTRYDIAVLGSRMAEGVSGVNMAKHDDFEGLAPRPIDTTFADVDGTCTRENAKATGVQDGLDLAGLQAGWNRAARIKVGLAECRDALYSKDPININQRARELSLFTGKTEAECLEKLNTGFHALHAAVAADFRAADPQDDDELIEWYRSTDSYIYELSAYHCDAGVPAPGWNYSGMCAGVADRLEVAAGGFVGDIQSPAECDVTDHRSKYRVLCLGDGIGDLTLSLLRRGFDAVYHDLAGSRTAAFAQMRLWMYTGNQYFPAHLTGQWNPEVLVVSNKYDAIVAFDVLEHMTDVEHWVRSLHAALKPDGLLMTQNAFACGSGPDGSIPMHLARNDRFEKDWDPLLVEVGFEQLSSNWYVKKEK